MDNVTELNSRRGRRESVSDAEIDAVIEQLMHELDGRLPSGEAVYEEVGSARTRCFARLKHWQHQGEAQRLENPGQLPTAVLDGLQLVMTRLEQDVHARTKYRETEWELERIRLNQAIAEAKKREIAETYRREDLEKQLAAVEHQLVASQTDNRHLRERNEALHQYNEQNKAEAHAAQQIADDRGVEMTTIREDRGQLRMALEKFRQREVDMRLDNNRLQIENDQLKDRCKELTLKADQQKLVHEQQNQESNTLQGQMKGMQEQLTALSHCFDSRQEITLESLIDLLRKELEDHTN